MKFKCPECEHNPDKEQIMIDGVDVSVCEAYSKHREGYCGWYTPCEGDSCSYKLDWALDQLKRKEQECEKYENALDEIMKFINISTCNICKGEDTQACSECNVNTIKDIINKAKDGNVGIQ